MGLFKKIKKHKGKILGYAKGGPVGAVLGGVLDKKKISGKRLLGGAEDFMNSDFFKVASSGIPGIGTYQGAVAANEANAEQAEKQIRFQERMSNSAYQRASEDMAAAGLNPMLAYSQGGASAPQGVSAQMSNVAEGVSEGISNSARAISDIAAKQQQMEQSAATTNAINAQTLQTGVQTKLAAGKIPEMELRAKAAGKVNGVIDKVGEKAANFGSALADFMTQKKLQATQPNDEMPFDGTQLGD